MVKFDILVNGAASNVFTPSRGLRQGCPLSPYPFLLVMDGLSVLLNEAFDSNRIQGITFGMVKSTRILFVDDALFFLGNFVEEERGFKDMLWIFSTSTGMVLNMDKLACYHNELEDEYLQAFQDLFQIPGFSPET